MSGGYVISSSFSCGHFSWNTVRRFFGRWVPTSFHLWFVLASRIYNLHALLLWPEGCWLEGEDLHEALELGHLVDHGYQNCPNLLMRQDLLDGDSQHPDMAKTTGLEPFREKVFGLVNRVIGQFNVPIQNRCHGCIKRLVHKTERKEFMSVGDLRAV